MWFGQLVIGPPGSGKSTYCNGMQQMLRALHRPHIVVNLDPANDFLPYDCAINLRDLVDHREVMERCRLGPNGALIHCLEYLLVNLDWLVEELKKFKDHYVLFDCPGQVEVYTHNDSMREIVTRLQKHLDARLTAVHLVDSTLCTDGYKYISALLVSLSGQLLLELPHVNVLTKIDLLKHHRHQLAFRLEYFAEVQDLSELLVAMEDAQPMTARMREHTALLCELIEDYNLVSFKLLDIQEKHSVLNLLKAIDVANGYSLGNLAADFNIFNVALDNTEDTADLLDTIQERYVDVDEDASHAASNRAEI
ncbi:putative ATP binding protein [Besnoitia besnoiti]|uniref:GPN-loop GTPase 2 n=1 Tax=Besnoitia besnoiti TaxID=94643 RepID=A0A2A9MMM0_BESBE|nr:putative ATP binding protein [Besnoitia besnoiti]PFH37027.1 putative ATP binding protein [Besnoitia besnoiti]